MDTAVAYLLDPTLRPDMVHIVSDIVNGLPYRWAAYLMIGGVVTCGVGLVVTTITMLAYPVAGRVLQLGGIIVFGIGFLSVAVGMLATFVGQAVTER